MSLSLNARKLPKGMKSKITQYEQAVDVAAHAGSYRKGDREHILATARRKRFLLEQEILKIIAEKELEIEELIEKYTKSNESAS
jgi:hypothetical protein